MRPRPARPVVSALREMAVGLSGGLPFWRRFVHFAAVGLLWSALGANWLHDVLWSAGDRLGRWAHR